MYFLFIKVYIYYDNLNEVKKWVYLINRFLSC
jgi:hypothetical protein